MVSPCDEKDHLHWLKAQGFKKGHSAMKPILEALNKLYPHIDNGIPRHEYTELKKITTKPITPAW